MGGKQTRHGSIAPRPPHRPPPRGDGAEVAAIMDAAGTLVPLSHPPPWERCDDHRPERGCGAGTLRRLWRLPALGAALAETRCRAVAPSRPSLEAVVWLLVPVASGGTPAHVAGSLRRKSKGWYRREAASSCKQATFKTVRCQPYCLVPLS